MNHYPHLNDHWHLNDYWDHFTGELCDGVRSD